MPILDFLRVLLGGADAYGTSDASEPTPRAVPATDRP